MAINTKNAITAYADIPSDAADAVTLVAENGNRVGLIIFNDSSAILYLLIGGTATTANFSFKLAAGAMYEMPYEYFTVKVTGIWASENGSAKVTEIRDN